MRHRFVQRTWTVSETVAGADRAAWSPDGQRLAFSDSKRLTVANVDDSDPKVIAGCGGDPPWSPDGADPPEPNRVPLRESRLAAGEA